MRLFAALLLSLSAALAPTGSLHSSDEIPGAPQKTPILIEGDWHRIDHLRFAGSNFNPEARCELE